MLFRSNLIDFSTNAVLRVDPEPDDNCFGDNRSFTQQPAGVTESLACP